MFHMIGMSMSQEDIYSLMTDEASWMIDNIYSAESRGLDCKTGIEILLKFKTLPPISCY